MPGIEDFKPRSGPARGYTADAIRNSDYFRGTTPRWGQELAAWGNSGQPDAFTQRYMARQAAQEAERRAGQTARGVAQTLGNLRGAWYPPAIRQKIGLLRRFGNFAMRATPQGRAVGLALDLMTLLPPGPTIEDVAGVTPVGKENAPASINIPSGYNRYMLCSGNPEMFLYDNLPSCAEWRVGYTFLTAAQVNAKPRFSTLWKWNTALNTANVVASYEKTTSSQPFTDDDLVIRPRGKWRWDAEPKFSPQHWPKPSFRGLAKRMPSPFWQPWQETNPEHHPRQEPQPLGQRTVITSTGTTTKPILDVPGPTIPGIPRRNIVEGKIMLTPIYGAAWRFLHSVTEVGDLVDCIFNSMPKKGVIALKREYGNKRPAGWKPPPKGVKDIGFTGAAGRSPHNKGKAIPLWRKIEYIMQNAHQLRQTRNVDGVQVERWAIAVKCMLENEIEDNIIGAFGAGVKDANKNLGRLFKGRTNFGTGPAL